MPSKFGGIPVSNDVPASRFGGVPVSDTPAPAAEPGIVSKVTNYITGTANKTAHNMNVENLLHAVDDIGDSIRNGTFSVKDTINRLDPSLGKLEDDTRAKLAAHDYSGATANVLPLAMSAFGGKAVDGAGAVADAAGDASQAVGKYGARVAENVPAVGKAAVNIGKAAAPNLTKAVAANFIPGIGHPISVGMLFHTAAQLAKGGTLAELGDAISGIMKPTKAEIMESSNARAANAPWKSIPDPVEGPQVAPTTPQEPVTLPSGRVVGKPHPDAAQPLPTSKVQIPTKFSAESTTDTAGTSAPATPATPATPAATAPTELNTATAKRIAEATQTGKLEALPPADKSALVKAVKAGDNEAANSLLDKHGAVDRVRQSVIDKVAVLAKYAQDHGIDLEAVAPADRIKVAKDALAHGKKNGLATPPSGRYTGGYSDSTLNMVKEKLAGK